MEEFSFPSIAPLNDASVFPSTSIWLITSLPQSTPTHFRRSFSSADGVGVTLSPNSYTKRDVVVPSSPALSNFGAVNSKLSNLDDDFDEEEEKMDSLWEQFHNLEVFIGSHFVGDNKKIARRKSIGDGFGFGFGFGFESIIRKDSTVSSRSVRRARRPNLVIMLRLLKKWFVNQGRPNN